MLQQLWGFSMVNHYLYFWLEAPGSAVTRQGRLENSDTGQAKTASSGNRCPFVSLEMISLKSWGLQNSIQLESQRRSVLRTPTTVLSRRIVLLMLASSFGSTPDSVRLGASLLHVLTGARISFCSWSMV